MTKHQVDDDRVEKKRRATYLWLEEVEMLQAARVGGSQPTSGGWAEVVWC